MKKVLLLVIVFVLLAPFAAAEEIPENARGVISIPCLNVKMPFYEATEKAEQEIIDDEESALFYQWQTASRIVDHAFSKCTKGNEWNIQKIFPGAYATIYFKESRFLYECYLTAKTDYLQDQEFCNNKIILPDSSYDILLSCCAEDTNHHFIAIFRRLREF